MSGDEPPPPGAPTPPQEEQPNGAYANYLPHDLKYSADFEDAVMQVVLNPPQQSDGIRIIPEESSEIPVEGISVKADAISLQSLPQILEEELPLPLDDPRRIFASRIPGIKLTHPGGYFEGGPGLDPNLDNFPEHFFGSNPSAVNSATLTTAVDKEVELHYEELHARLKERRRAKEKNEQIERELRNMREEHSMELKVNPSGAHDIIQYQFAAYRRRCADHLMIEPLGSIYHNEGMRLKRLIGAIVREKEASGARISHQRMARLRSRTIEWVDDSGSGHGDIGTSHDSDYDPGPEERESVAQHEQDHEPVPAKVEDIPKRLRVDHGDKKGVRRSVGMGTKRDSLEPRQANPVPRFQPSFKVRREQRPKARALTAEQRRDQRRG
ncbi:hypothetical protein PRZ48_000338 [Zasmidium cellare]|uniref:Something about silencing protein 4 domain-containing protein n=1 Tax=Zasmidium cellare TaxID=395010 RepID=A0ABR0EZM6_ZASCE|nr:hypothetical protein PRZ48_000338 [Zasmidium cellare]